MNNSFNKCFNNSWVELVVRWFLGMTFVYACYHKIADPARFAKIIYGYNLFPDVSVNIIAIVLPFIELLSGLALIFGIYPRSAAIITNGLLLGFIAAFSINLVRGHQFDCGCFSFDQAGHPYSVELMLARDIVYFILGLHVLFFEKCRRWCLWQSGSLLNNIDPADCR